MTRNRLVDFVIEHGRIETYFCMLHRHDHGDFRCEMRTLSDYNLIYMLRGRAVWQIEGKKHPLQPGRLLVVPIGQRHEAYPLTKRTLLLSLHVNVRLPGGRDVFELLNPPMLQDVSSDSRLAKYLDFAADEFDRTDQVDAVQAMPGWTRLIVNELFRSADQADTLAPEPIDPLVADLLEELHRRVAIPTTLDDLARWSGYTGQHINRLFGDALGVTPLKYLARLRIDRARNLLLDHGLTIAAVAEQIGFDDPYYFSRLFKQHVGVSPSDYRAQASSEFPS